VHEDFFKEKGEGLHHIGFAVKDLGKMRGGAEKVGLKVVQGFKKKTAADLLMWIPTGSEGQWFELIRRPAPRP